MNIQNIKITEIKPYENNPRINDGAVESVANSIKEFGFKVPIVIDRKNVIVCGHTRYKASLSLNLKEVPCVIADDLTEEQIKAYRLADNKVSEIANWDEEKLLAELKELDDSIDMSLFDFDEKALTKTIDDLTKEREPFTKLEDKFLIPPFSVLDTRRGNWQDRKKSWNALIGDEGESRDETLGFKSLVKDNGYEWAGFSKMKTVSLLDAVLAEIINLWFCPKFENIKTFDPFAGDTVFGFVSAYLGNVFTGIELREEQAKLNNDRVADMSANYICDDAQNLLNHIDEDSQDLMFSCPPYFNLEKYSDLPNDASNQDFDGFVQILDNAFSAGCKALKNNRFAVIVMSNVRDKKGAYLDICSEITNIMQRNGLILYNELILLNVVGTGAVRASRNMTSRKVVRVHQEILVYYKGNPNEIKNNFNKIEIGELNDSEDE